MNPIERVARGVDRFQQEHTLPSVVYAVMKKFGDDNAGVLAGNLAYSAFGAVFPLLLLLVTVLGLVLGNDPSARSRVLHSTLSQFPVIGTQLGSNIHALQKGSPVALAIGLVGLVWASTGLAQAGLFTMAQVWNLPGPDRPNFTKRLARSLGFLAVMGLGLLLTTGLASFGSFGKQSLPLAIGAELLAVAVNVGQYFLAFRVLTPKAVETRRLWPGAVFGGIAWTILQAAGGYLVGHNLRNESEVYGTFAIVLGLMAWIYLGVQLSVYAAEINTVIARRLWPRAMVQPPLTEADQASLALQAEENQRRPEQQVDVSFSEDPMTEDRYIDLTHQKPSGQGDRPEDDGPAPDDGTDLSALTKSELYEEARKLSIAGRSQMTREELEDAVRRSPGVS
ncbi:MAG TPA: YihY/virulence factor BrkB family protein [Acidimicrobiales bacterium]|nr:YihY/virulence factor BrkB family protein [Acidimicrobiales bacterium]